MVGAGQSFDPGRDAAGTKGTTGGKSQEILDVVEFTRQRLGFDPNPLQASMLRGGRRGIVNCTRQWGKSTVAAAKAVHRAFCRPDSLILVLSPSARQSGELVRKAEEFVSRLGIKARGDGANEISIAFPNQVADCGAAAQRGDPAGSAHQCGQ